MSEVSSIKTSILVTNAIMTFMWIRVLRTLFEMATRENNAEFCETNLKPALVNAIVTSFLEGVNAVMGVTKSNPANVIMFVVVRAGVEFLAAPALPCDCMQHLFTAACWGFGEMCRFGCFTVDGIMGGSDTAKSIRYTVGPVAFFCGAFGEWLMVIQVLRTGNPDRSALVTAFIVFCVMAWPIGFVSLFKQLLKQRKKHFKAQANKRKNI
mmetsp:Transcript_2900/g.4020  ORF Transcript_2900/g.4020 Transcript_2900/m.4020 type:complete len:210 (-) Transcript_2900:1174-1803(-)